MRCKGEQPWENCLSSTTPSLFQLCHFPPFITSNRVYPSGFFATISSPPAVLEEPFTAASAESVTLASLALAHSHAQTVRNSPQSSSLLSNTLFVTIFSPHHILSNLYLIILSPSASFCNATLWFTFQRAISFYPKNKLLSLRLSFL